VNAIGGGEYMSSVEDYIAKNMKSSLRRQFQRCHIMELKKE
jgi:hypothetical protein